MNKITITSIISILLIFTPITSKQTLIPNNSQNIGFENKEFKEYSKNQFEQIEYMYNNPNDNYVFNKIIYISSNGSLNGYEERFLEDLNRIGGETGWNFSSAVNSNEDEIKDFVEDYKNIFE